jgi:DNA-binding response OmpR family regulator
MRTALLFEIDVGKRVALLRTLGRFGWSVDAPHNSEWAWRCIHTRRHDLVLLGWSAPIGSVMLAAIRGSRSRRTTPVIVMPAAADGTGVDAAIELGANDILRWPTSAEAVRVITDRWVIERPHPAPCPAVD